MEHRINKLFHQSVETTMEVAELLSANITLVAQRMANTLLNDGKILVVGNGPSGALGQLFASSLVNRLHYERPSLPALSLQTDSVIMTGIAEHNGAKDIYAKQIRALGSSGDLLLVIADTHSSKNTDHAIVAAHDKSLQVVVLCAETNELLDNISSPDDVALRLPGKTMAGIYQSQLQILLVLTDLIDFQLFGVGDTL